MNNAYQSELWKSARKESGEPEIEISLGNSKINAFEKKKDLKLFNANILFAEGTPEADSKEDMTALLKEFKKASKKYFYGLIAPSVVNPCKESFERAGFWKVSNNTVLVDLTKSEEELWQALEKKSARWGAKFGEKNGLTLELAKKGELRRFYQLYKKTSEQGGFHAETERFIETLRESEISRVYLVKNKNKLVAGGLILFDRKDDYSILILTSVSEEGQKMQAMPFLYWNLIKESKKEGMKKLDLGGYDLENSSGKMRQINSFKERFGGVIVEQPIYSTNFIYPLLRKIYRILKRFRGFFKLGSA